MLFNSYIYILVFLPLTYAIYRMLSASRFARSSAHFIVVASLVFYGYWEPKYLFILMSSVAFNYAISKKLHDPVNGKKFLVFGICCNVALLGYFKYWNFFIENLSLLGGPALPNVELALPLAISFFTFQQIAFLVDNYRSEWKVNFSEYLFFVVFFPHLLAGPLVHHSKLIPQFYGSDKDLNLGNIYKGMLIFGIGLVKKVVVADHFAQYANTGYSISSGDLNLVEAWVTTMSYTLQLYFDFSGYCDMAIGSALFFNIDLPWNFNSPYKSLSIQEFWGRWHITLGQWLRNYIYVPLGGNRNGTMATLRNLFLTFLIGGIWHGAGWTFVIWGAAHGVAVSVHRLWQLGGRKMPKALAWLLTFLFVHLTWVFFRASSFGQAKLVIKRLFSFHRGVLYGADWSMHFAGKNLALISLTLFVGLGIATLGPNGQAILEQRGKNPYLVFCIGILTAVALTMLSRESEFLYFRF